jgi:hypothetical protein
MFLCGVWTWVKEGFWPVVVGKFVVRATAIIIILKHVDGALSRNSRVQPPPEVKEYNYGNGKNEDSAANDSTYKEGYE